MVEPGYSTGGPLWCCGRSSEISNLWRLVCNKDMPLRAQSGIGVERSRCQANAALGVSGRPIDDRRAADLAKAAPEPGWGFVVILVISSLPCSHSKSEILTPARLRNAAPLSLAAPRAMAMQRPEERPRNGTFDAAAEAALVKHRHAKLPLTPRAAIRHRRPRRSHRRSVADRTLPSPGRRGSAARSPTGNRR
jgi:hypothetical protein